MSSPVPATAGVEWKVKAATAASYVGGVVALFLLSLLSDVTLVEAYATNYLPAGVATFVLPLIPAVVTFGAAYITKHTPRTAGLGTEVDTRILEVADRLEAVLESRVREHVAPAPTDQYDRGGF